ncbi:MAG: SagB/ThcOx family dehydrogenase [Pseudomonadota bacterium]
MTPHYLDWQNQPIVFKDYPGLTPVLLPSDFSPPEDKLSTLLKEKEWKDTGREAELKDLSLILRLAYTLTAQARQSGGVNYFRSVASAGALYPTEIYVATHSMKGLADGLYHFAIHRHCLYPIRTQGLTTHLPEAPTLCFFLTAIFFRSAWKYRERSYRYHLLDTGHLVENLVLALTSQGLPFNLSYDFDDERVNHLLGVDETKEVALSMLHIPGKDSLFMSGEKLQELESLPQGMRNASRVSLKEIGYSAVNEIHRAGTGISSPSKSESEISIELGVKPEIWTKVISPSPWPEVMNYSEAVFGRRSRRNFIKGTLPKDNLSALIDTLCAKDLINATHKESSHRSISVGFLVDHVEGIEPGFYLVDTLKKSYGPVHHGHFLEMMAHICLDQAWLANAAIHFLFFTNFDMLEQSWGARGYRYAMMSAGRMGERLYLISTAMGIGCCGIGAFYDDEASQLLGLNEKSRLLYLVAVGPIKS